MSESSGYLGFSRDASGNPRARSDAAMDVGAMPSAVTDRLGRPGVVTLMYHSLTRDGDPYPATSFHRNKYTVALDRFREQVAIAGRGNVVFSFDDGHRSIYELGFPAFMGRVPAIVFVSTAFIGNDDWLGINEIRDMSDQGVEIGAHGVNHLNLAALPPRRLQEELESSRARLQEITGREVPAMSLIGGHATRRVMAAARDLGYQQIYCSVPGAGTTRWGAVRRQWITAEQRLEVFRRMCEGWVPGTLALRYHGTAPVKTVLSLWRRMRAQTDSRTENRNRDGYETSL